MRIKAIVFFIFLLPSCSTIKNIEGNDGVINAGNSNFIFSSPDESRNYSKQEVQIQINNLKEEIEFVENSILEIERTQEPGSQLKEMKKELKELKSKKSNYQELLSEWEKFAKKG